MPLLPFRHLHLQTLCLSVPEVKPLPRKLPAEQLMLYPNPRCLVADIRRTWQAVLRSPFPQTLVDRSSLWGNVAVMQSLLSLRHRQANHAHSQLYHLRGRAVRQVLSVVLPSSLTPDPQMMPCSHLHQEANGPSCRTTLHVSVSALGQLRVQGDSKLAAQACSSTSNVAVLSSVQRCRYRMAVAREQGSVDRGKQ